MDEAGDILKVKRKGVAAMVMPLRDKNRDPRSCVSLSETAPARTDEHEIQNGGKGKQLTTGMMDYAGHQVSLRPTPELDDGPDGETARLVSADVGDLGIDAQWDCRAQSCRVFALTAVSIYTMSWHVERVEVGLFECTCRWCDRPASCMHFVLCLSVSTRSVKLWCQHHHFLTALLPFPAGRTLMSSAH